MLFGFCSNVSKKYKKMKISITNKNSIVFTSFFIVSFPYTFAIDTKNSSAKITEEFVLLNNYSFLIAAWAAASLAIGTRNGEQET